MHHEIENQFYLPSNVVNYLSQLKVIEELDVIDSLLSQLVSLFIAKHISVIDRGLLCSACGVHLQQVLDFGIAERSRLSWWIMGLTFDHDFITELLRKIYFINYN